MRRGSRCTWSRPGPIATTRRCSAHPGWLETLGAAARRDHRPSRSRLRQRRHPRTARRARAHRRDRPQGRTPAPLQAGNRWVVERTHSWMNGYGKLRRCTERSGPRGRLLPLPGRRLRRHPLPHPARPHPLPLARSPHHPTPQVTPIAGRSKPAESAAAAARSTPQRRCCPRDRRRRRTSRQHLPQVNLDRHRLGAQRCRISRG